MAKTCFICNQSEEFGSNSSGPSGKVVSFLLGKILGISIENLNKFHAQNEFDKIVYCSTCLERILYIQDILRELERLQKTLESEKFLIESQLKESAKDVKHSATQDDICTQIRTDFLKEMQQVTLSSEVCSGQNYKDPNDIALSGVMTDPIINEEIRDVSLLELRNFNLNMKSEIEIDDERNVPSSWDSDPLALGCSDDRNPLAFNVIQTNKANLTNESELKKCELCHKTLKSIEGLQVHVQRVHKKVYNFNCSLCSFGCQSSTSMNSHMMLHNIDDHGAGGFQCNRCPDRFYSQNILRHHLRFAHGVLSKEESSKRPKPKKCNDCGKILSSAIAWKKHVLSVHKMEFKYKCQLCGYGTPILYNLTRHMISHENQTAILFNS